MGSGGVFAARHTVLSSNPLLLRHSTWITPNIFAAFFSTGTLLASSLIVLRGDRRSYIFAGVMAGLAASSKYNAGLVAVAIPAAHVLRNGPAIAELRPLVVAAVTSVLAFLLSSPFIVLDPLTAARSILIVIREYQTGHAGAEGGSLAANTWWMFHNFGYAGLLAVAACFSPRARALLPTGLFIVAYFILLVVQKVHFDRNLLPLVPAVLLLMAVGIDTISHMIARAFPNARTITSGLCGILALALFARPAMSSLDEVARYDPDPRAEARVWANGLLPRTPERAIAVEAYAPYIAEQGRAVKGIFLAAIMDPAALAPFSYLVLSRQGSGRYFQGSYATEQANLAALKARSCDRRQFPADSAEPDYVILIFEC